MRERVAPPAVTQMGLDRDQEVSQMVMETFLGIKLKRSKCETSTPNLAVWWSKGSQQKAPTQLPMARAVLWAPSGEHLGKSGLLGQLRGQHKVTVAGDHCV